MKRFLEFLGRPDAELGWGVIISYNNLIYYTRMWFIACWMLIFSNECSCFEWIIFCILWWLFWQSQHLMVYANYVDYKHVSWSAACQNCCIVKHSFYNIQIYFISDYQCLDVTPWKTTVLIRSGTKYSSLFIHVTFEQSRPKRSYTLEEYQSLKLQLQAQQRSMGYIGHT